MRFAYILLMTAVALLSFHSAQATGTEVESRLLRSHKNTESEERGLDSSIVNKLDDMWRKMYHSKAARDNIFASWYTGWQSVDDAVEFMQSQKLGFEATAYFVAKYRKYIAKNGGPPY